MTQPDDRSARNKIEHFRISAPTSQKRIYRIFTTPAAYIGLCDLECRNTKPERRGSRATRGPAARVRSKEGLAGIRGLWPKVYGTNQALRNVSCCMGQSITPRSSMNMMRSLTSRAGAGSIHSRPKDPRNPSAYPRQSADPAGARKDPEHGVGGIPQKNDCVQGFTALEPGLGKRVAPTQARCGHHEHARRRRIRQESANDPP